MFLDKVGIDLTGTRTVCPLEAVSAKLTSWLANKAEKTILPVFCVILAALTPTPPLFCVLNKVALTNLP